MALDAAQAKKSRSRYHQDLGLVGEEHRNTIEAPHAARRHVALGTLLNEILDGMA